MAQTYAPFSCTFSREVPDLLDALEASLILTTYQAGKVIVLSSNGDDGLVQLSRTFARPMGLVADRDRLAIATAHEVVLLANAPALARSYPGKPDYYDALYLPRASYYTGTLDLHDMAWSGRRLLAVNTVFSCLCQVDGAHSFTPVWKPPFVSALTPEDRCHLNGVAMDADKPRYVTALSATDAPKGWREDRLRGGVVVEVASGEVVASGLAMPHSPRLYDGDLYVLASATGELLCVEAESGRSEVVNRVPGFARGLARCGDYLFVGHSKIRKKHVFGDLPIAAANPTAGVTLIHLPSGRIAGAIQYLASCEEIYDVQVLPGVRRPGLLNVERLRARGAVHAPMGGYWANPEEPAAAPEVPATN